MVSISGTAEGDFLKGTSADDILQGLAGNDTLVADDGSDTLIGGSDDDALYGGLGDDVFLTGQGDGSDQIFGGPGNDKLLATSDNMSIEIGRLEELEEISSNGHSNVQLVISSHSNWVDLSSVTLSGFTKIYTGDFGAQLIGTKFSDKIFGGSGFDLIAGGGGYDEIHGGGGADRLIIAAGTYFGDEGDDNFSSVSTDQDVAMLSGGAGSDTFSIGVGATQASGSDFLALSGVADVVTDFKAGAGGDRIDLTMMMYTNFLMGWDRSANPFLAGYFRLQQIGLDTIFQIDRTGAGSKFVDVLRLENVAAADLNIANFDDKYSPTVWGATYTGTTAADALDGTELPDTIKGLAGNDVINGHGGADALFGDAGDDNLLGGLGDDSMSGGLGNDYLDGGPGADRMNGGAGNDNFEVDNIYDVVVEAAGAGSDTIFASATYVLSSNVESLILTGSTAIDGTGNELGNTLTGNAGNNHLYGLAGNDLLDGKGGHDTLEGGIGNDIYVVEDANDIVIEWMDGGSDTVKAAMSYVLNANIENLTLTGSDFLAGTGNEFNNALIGNTGANHLYGLGGNDTLDGKAGADTLVGGPGNDTYVLDDVNDEVVEKANEGTDTVTAGFSYSLLEKNVENLTLTGSAAVDGTGNSTANWLKGNAAANYLFGLGGDDKLTGGLGADIMVGGVGNDNYNVENIGDLAIESVNEGNDSVSASISYALPSNIEKLTLTGAFNLNGTGNTLGNSLVGNGGANFLGGLSGKDTLSGGLGDDVLSGGNGSDNLTGGAGADRFLFDVVETSANKDTIKDFEHKTDSIVLSRAAFLSLADNLPVTLRPDGFFSGSAATTSLHHIIYNQATGALYYDADGVGGQAQVQLALLSTKPVLDAGDILLI